MEPNKHNNISPNTSIEDPEHHQAPQQSFHIQSNNSSPSS